MTQGTSNSAAYFAGVVALLKAAEPGLRTRHLLWFAHYGKARQVALDRDGMPLPTGRSADGQRLPQISNAPMPMRRMPMPARYAGPALSREQQILLYRQRQAVLSQRPATPSSNFAAATATPSRQLRVWQTPTLQELREEVQKDR
jgi:hypothetical protein